MLAFCIHLWYYIGAEKNSKENPGVAKFGIALEWGSRGPEFESQHSDHHRSKDRWFSFFTGTETALAGAAAPSF